MNSALSLLAAAIDHPPPWLLRYLTLARQVVNAGDRSSVAGALNAAARSIAQPERFVEQSALPPGEPYESFITRTGSVPTRDNTHDLFNGLMWLSYPQTKQRLNTLQVEQITRHGTRGTRGALRDALTLFDENAAIMQAPASLIESLRRRDWKELFVAQRAQWFSTDFALFGHALLEKLLQPRKAMTAHVWLVTELTDAAIASSLTDDRLHAKDFLPLPVLGVPGWWQANAEPGFYDDTDVFRPLR